jgi:hypothetical protein
LFWQVRPPEHGLQESDPPQPLLMEPHWAPAAPHVVGVQHAPALQLLPEQSLATLQFFPSPQAGQLPPQSTSDSDPFRTPSLQAGARHVVWQTIDVQSVGAPHVLPTPQGLHEPPQSTSDSEPFFWPSLQPGAAQVLPEQMLD